jgi:hypothetical protein
VARSVLTIVAAVILAAVPAGSDDGAASRFAVRMIKMGGRFDRPEVRAHLEHSAAIGFNAVWVYGGQAGTWTAHRAPDGPFLDPSFLDLMEWSRAQRVRVFVSVNPVAAHGGRYVFTDPANTERIRKFFRLLHRAGVRDFVLSFDDQPTVLTDLADVSHYGSSSARGHLDPARKLERKLPRKTTFWLCAAAYADVHLGDGNGPYSRDFLAGLAKLPDRIGIVWTGPGVISRSITAADIERTRRRLGERKILLYDNYPVNDNGDGGALALILGPLRRRDSALASQAEVYLSCPMNELAGSRLVLETVADYLLNPEGYDPDVSALAAMERLSLGKPATLEALRTQSMEWGGWVGTRNYRGRDEDNVFTAAAALQDPAQLALWTYVVKRYPERMAALARLEDPLFREALLSRMEARLAVGRTLPLLVELHGAAPRERDAVWARIEQIRGSVTDNLEATRLLDRFLEAAGVRIPASVPTLESVP